MKVQDLKDLPHQNEDPNEWDLVHPNLRVLGYELIEYCQSRRLPLVITGIIFQPLKCSKTAIHADKRAFDVSVKGWTMEQILACEKYFNDLYAKAIGAIGAQDGQARACFFESPAYNGRGSGAHFHFQVRPMKV